MAEIQVLMADGRGSFWEQVEKGSVAMWRVWAHAEEFAKRTHKHATQNCP